MSVYPKWIYHAEKEAQIVKDKAAHEAAGEGWGESPADCVKKISEPKPVKKTPSKEGNKA